MSNLRIYKENVFTLDDLAHRMIKQINANLPSHIHVEQFAWNMKLVDLITTALAGPRERLMSFQKGDKEKRRVTGWEGHVTLVLSGATDLDSLELTANSCLHLGSDQDEDGDLHPYEARIFQEDFKTIGVSNLIASGNPYDEHQFAFDINETTY